MNSEEKATNSGNTILVAIATVMGVLIGLMFGSHKNGGSQEYPATLQGKMSEVLDIVEHHYVDSIETDSLSECLLGVMLSELDPHSVYLTARETAKNNEMMQGQFEGVGLALRRLGDSTFIGEIIADGPSVGSGLMPGDLIWAVDGEQVSAVGMPADTVVQRLRGPRRSMVKIEVRRGKEGREHLAFDIRRGVVHHKTLPYSGMLHGLHLPLLIRLHQP